MSGGRSGVGGDAARIALLAIACFLLVGCPADSDEVGGDFANGEPGDDYFLSDITAFSAGRAPSLLTPALPTVVPTLPPPISGPLTTPTASPTPGPAPDEVSPIPALMETSHQPTLAQGATSTIRVRLHGSDPRDRTDLDFADEGFHVVPSSNSSRDIRWYPVYAAPGEIEFTVWLGPGLEFTGDIGFDPAASPAQATEPERVVQIRRSFEERFIAGELSAQDFRAHLLVLYESSATYVEDTLNNPDREGPARSSEIVEAFASMTGIPALGAGDLQNRLALGDLFPIADGPSLQPACRARLQGLTLDALTEQLLCWHYYYGQLLIAGDIAADDFLGELGAIAAQAESRVAAESILLGEGTVHFAEWQIRAIEPGVHSVRISASRIDQATPRNWLSDDEVAALPLHELQLVLDLTIESTDEVLGAVVAPTEGQGETPSQPESTTSRARLALALMLAVVALPGAPLLISAWGTGGRRPDLAPSSSHEQTGDTGLILSGGGMRAAAFSLGVASYIVKQDHYAAIRQIASVSGGSFTNGVLAGSAHAEDPEKNVTALSTYRDKLESKGLPLELSAGAFVVLQLIAFVVIVSDHPSSASRWGLALVVAALAWLLYAKMILPLTLRLWIPRLINVPSDARMHNFAVSKSIQHVFTAATKKVRFAHIATDRVWFPKNSSRPGSGADSEKNQPQPRVLVSQAVRASAAFPGLPSVRLSLEDLGLLREKDERSHLILRDGGVKNNLGHLGSTLASSEPGWLNDYGNITRWVVVDASARMDDGIWKKDWAESLLNALGLGIGFDAADALGSRSASATHQSAISIRQHFEKQPGSGIYLHLGQSPVDLCTQTINMDPSGRGQELIAKCRRGELIDDAMATTTKRAIEALRLLLRQDPHAAGKWTRYANIAQGVPTTLHSLKPEQVHALVALGYAQAAVLSHISFGWEPPAPDEFHQAVAEAPSPARARVTTGPT